jgi:hypothetical protein
MSTTTAGGLAVTRPPALLSLRASTWRPGWSGCPPRRRRRSPMPRTRPSRPSTRTTVRPRWCRQRSCMASRASRSPSSWSPSPASSTRQAEGRPRWSWPPASAPQRSRWSSTRWRLASTERPTPDTRPRAPRCSHRQCRRYRQARAARRRHRRRDTARRERKDVPALAGRPRLCAGAHPGHRRRRVRHHLRPPQRGPRSLSAPAVALGRRRGRRHHPPPTHPATRRHTLNAMRGRLDRPRPIGTRSRGAP